MENEHICTMLIEAVTDLLLTACQLDVSTDDPSYATVVRAGRLQDDPTVNVVSILVHPNDPEEPRTWMNEIVGDDLKVIQNPWGGDPYRMPQHGYEIGGGEQWWRRFTVQLTMFWMNKSLTRTQARDYSFLVLGRAEEAIKEGASTFGVLQDAWGEQVWGWYVRRTHMLERGGPDVDWIWNGRLWLEFGTDKT